MKTIDYTKLRLDVLMDLVSQRELECKDNRTDMLRHLKLDDEGKYIRETIYEPYGDDKTMVGVDIHNRKHLMEMSELVEKHKAKTANIYISSRVYFITDEKLTID